MTRAATLVLWSTVTTVGCLGVAAVLIAGPGTGSAAPLRAVDPAAPTRLATSVPTAPNPSQALTRPTAPRARTKPVAPLAVTARPESPVAPASGAAATAVPVGVTITSAGIGAPVRPVGVDQRGEVAIPERVGTVGWYRYSAPAGSAAGSTVLVGHVDSATEGPGAFFRLRDVDRGDRVVLELAGGRRLDYRVVSRAQFPKSAVPLAALFSLSGQARLTLITCGGSFDATARSYRDNIVITALPL